MFWSYINDKYLDEDGEAKKRGRMSAQSIIAKECEHGAHAVYNNLTVGNENKSTAGEA